jgi:hypothetical protein
MVTEELQLAKILVNNHEYWKTLDTLLNGWYNNKQKELETALDLDTIRILQGEIKLIKRFYSLRDALHANKS